ncbi:MAG: PIN domain-containing protein [Nitrososphaerales archaeon]
MVDSLVLDTTYLLPIFGLESRLPHFNDSFRRLLTDYEVRYNPVSLLEAKWLVLRLAKKKRGDLETFLKYYREGIGAIEKEEKIRQTAFTDENVEELSDKVLIDAKLGDYFDRQIYSTASRLNCLLLTEDERLHKLYETLALRRPKGMLKWKDVTH